METLTVKSSVKSAEVYRNGVVKTADESAAEVLHVDDTSGVYKLLMVRMSVIGLTNLRMYGCGQPQLVWFSKYARYEKPYCVIGAVKPIGSKQTPKSICTDRIIGTRKGTELQLQSAGEEL